MLSTVQHIKQSVFKLRRCAILSISPQSVNIWELWRPAAGVLEMNVGPLLFDRGFLLLNSPMSSLSYYLYHDAPNLESSAAKPCHDSCSRHFCLALSSLNAHSLPWKKTLWRIFSSKAVIYLLALMALL